MSTQDDLQAAEYRRKEQARVSNRIAREAALAGDPAAYQRLVERFKPLLPDEGWDPESPFEDEDDDASMA